MQLTISVRPRLAALAAVLLVAAGAVSAREASAATTVNTSSFSADDALLDLAVGS